MYVIVIEWNNTEPEVHGTYKRQSAAEKAMKKVQVAWGEWEWNHFTGINVIKIKKGQTK